MRECSLPLQRRAGQEWSSELLTALLDGVERSYAVDPDRIYVTGLSMGGAGAWDLAMATPDRFAAIAPVAGWGRPADAERLARLPVWAFHGANDRITPLRRMEEMVEALRRCGGNVRSTVYAQSDHDCWTATYADPELYTWFLSHTRTEQGAQPPMRRGLADECGDMMGQVDEQGGGKAASRGLADGR